MISFYLNRGQAKISTNEWWNCVIAPVGPALCALKCGLRLKLVFLMHENFLALRRAQLNKSREFNLEKVNRINPWCFDLFVNVNINKPRYVSKCSFAFTKLRNKRALVLLFCVPWIFCPSLSWVSVMRALSAWMTAAGDRRQLSVSCLILPTLDKSNMCSYSYLTAQNRKISIFKLGQK